LYRHKVIFYFLLCPLLWWSGQAVAQTGSQLRLDPDYEVDRLVKDVFATDRCNNIFNVRRIGDNPDGIGYFESPRGTLGFSRGIVLSTGRIQDARGPNNSTNTETTVDEDPTPDPDLDIASGGKIFDRSGIEFEFTPVEPTVTFRYVFASEEYPEYVGAQYNDIFGFFISGPGFNGPYADGAINVAQVPGSRQSVAINSINKNKNSQYYIDNQSPGAPNFSSLEYDGLTVILTATVKVIPCETYRIRLLIGDVNDGGYDSAVFLEAGSFDLGTTAVLEGGENKPPIVAYEGCTPATLRILRGPDSDTTREQTVTYRVGNGAVASDTSDFNPGGGTATIAPGETFVDVPIEAYADTLAEGDETAWIVLNSPCACSSDSVQLIVREPAPLEIGAEEDFYYCPGSSSTLSAGVRGGIAPLSYRWNFGSTDPEPLVTSSLPDTVTVEITDACGDVISWRAAAKASSPPTLDFPAQDISACWGETALITTSLTGVGPFDITYRVDGGEPQVYTRLSGGTIDWPVTRGGTYQITSVEDRACGTQMNELLTVNLYRPVLNPTFTDPTCAGGNDGSLSATHLPTVGPYSMSINGTGVTAFEQTGLTEGTYELVVTDALGCTDSTLLELSAPDSIGPISISCEQLRRPPLRISASGGTPPYQYSTNGEDYFGAVLFDELDPGSAYRVYIRDAVGCEIEQSPFFLPEAAPHSVELPNFVSHELGQSTRMSIRYRVPNSQIDTYRWEPAELFDCASCAEPVISAPYTQTVSVVVRDIFGCTDSLTTRVAVNGRSPLYVPNAFSPNNDGNNDYLKVYGTPGLVQEILSFRIYTRWGDLVWEELDFLPTDSIRGWDGLLGGRPANSGVYTWVAEYLLFDGTVTHEGGTTVLLGR
jgi:gliding motility-associated-like protein